MVFIPLDTDAPIYHWPWATVGLIATNVVTFAVSGSVGEANQALLLEYGNGLHPLEWITCNFVHFSVIHLIGNMIFLWGFGLVVEGKLGWWRFLLVYFAIGIGHAGLEQLIMLGYEGDVQGSGGASGVIFGLLAMSLVWAPKNEMTCMYFVTYFFYLRIFTFEMTILTFSLIYIGIDLIFAMVFGFQMNSSVIHLLGALFGAGIAIAMLKRNWVDCENWDLFAVLNGTYGQWGERDTVEHQQISRPIPSSPPTSDLPRPADKTEHEEIDPHKRVVRKAHTLRKLRESLAAGEPGDAFTEYATLKKFDRYFRLGERDLRALVDGLYQAHRWPEVVPLLEELIERFPKSTERARLMLAGVLIEVESRPQYALRVLEGLDPASLSGPMNRRRKRYVAVAERMVDEGVIEFQGANRLR